MRNSRCLVAFAAMFAATVGYSVTFTTHQWKADSSGSWSGSITNAEHWSTGTVPMSNARAWFDSNYYKSMELTFPEGYYTNWVNFYPAVYGNQTTTIDGHNTVWVHPAATDGVEYHTTPFAIYQNASVRSFVGYALSGATPNPVTSPNLVFSNFVISASLYNSSRSAKVEFKQGLYEFLHPCGHSWNWSIQKPYLCFFDLNSNDASTKANLMDLIEVSFTNSTINAPVVAIRGNAISNVLTIAGGSHTMNTVDMPGRYDGANMRNDRTVTDVYFDNVELNNADRFNIGNDTTHGTSRVFRVWFRNQSKATLPSMYSSSGDSELNIDNSEVKLGYDNSHSQNINYDTVRSVRWKVTNGGQLICNQLWNGQGFYFGPEQNAERKHWLTVEDGSIFKVQTGAKASFKSSLLTFKDSLLDVAGGGFYAGASSETSPMDVVFDHAVYTNSASAYWINNGYGSITITNGSDIVLTANAVFGGDGLAPTTVPAKLKVDMYDGRILTTTTSAILYIGNSANSEVIFNMYGGVISNAVNGSGVQIGEGGYTQFNLYDGVIDTFNPRVCSDKKSGYDYSSQSPVELNVYGGRIRSRNTGNGQDNGFAIGGAYADSTRKAKLTLNGGVVESYTTHGGKNAACRGGSGRAMLAANGGTLRMPCTSPCTIWLFDEAKLGAKGLTIDSNGYDITIKQHVWANADGEEGALIFTGAGTKCPTGNVEQVSNIVLAGGVTDLSSIDQSTVQNLIVTNGATLKLNPATPLVVKGALTLEGGKLAMASECTVGTTYDLFKFTTEPSETVKTALANLKYQVGGLSGLGSARTADISVVADGEGGFVTKMAVRAAQTLTIELEAGVSNATENVTYDALDTLKAVPGLSAALTLSGTYQYGHFLQDGLGSVEFADWSKLNSSDYQVKQGVLTITEPAAGLTLDKQLTFKQESTNDIFIINNTVDVAMPVPSGNNQNGEFVKRGPGRLTFEVSGTANKFLGGYGKSKINNGVWSWAVENIGQLTYDTVSGMITTSGVPPLLVAEGELVLKAKTAGAMLNVGGCIAVGTSTQVGTVQPGLVVDGVSLLQDNYPHKRFNLGCALNYTAGGGGAVRTNDFVTTPYLILTNGASFSMSNFDMARFCMTTNVQPWVEMDGSTLIVGYDLLLNRAQNEHPRMRYSIRNDSKIYANWICPGYPSVMEVDNSVIAKNANLEGTPIRAETCPSTSSTLDIRFRNGSKFYSGKIDPSDLNVKTCQPFTFLFEDSEWYPTNLVADCTLEWSKPEQLYIVTTNRGLRLPVPATATWTVKQPINGTGDLANSGKGTLKLGADAVAYSGVTYATDADGVVDLDGNTLAISIGGAGTFQNGTVTGGICVRDGLVPTVASTVTLSGTKRVRVVNDTALTPGSQFTVLNYEGTAPVASQFRLVRSGAASGLSGTFTVDGGKVTCSVTEAPGAIFIIR